MVAGWMTQCYLDRLQVESAGPPDLAMLRVLHRRHLEHVPFENLSVHLGEPIVLDDVELVAKIVDRHRGGFCYELNGGFAWLLRSLGYRVDLLEAGVFHSDGSPGPHFDHLVLRVELDQRWLVDVGFGDNFIEPIPLQAGVDTADRNGAFRLDAVATGEAAMDLRRDGKPQYRVALTSYRLAAFDEMARFHQTSPQSHFTQNIVCSMLTPTGRSTISGRTLIVTHDAQRTERDLDDDALLACYRDTFGIDLPRVPPMPR